MSEEDRRIFERFDVIAQVRVRHGQVDHIMEVLNVSRGGALIDLGTDARPGWLKLDRRIQIRLLGPDGDELIDAEADVVRIVESRDARTFAVQFEGVQGEAHLKDVLRSVRPPPLPSGDDE